MFPFHCFNNQFNIIFPSTPRSSKWSLFHMSPHQKPVCSSPVPHSCHIPRRSRFAWFVHKNNIWWAVRIIKFLLMQFSPLPCYLVPLRPNYLQINWNMIFCISCIHVCSQSTSRQSDITYLLTPWSRVLLEKLTGSAAIQEIPRIFGTRRFLTVLISARHLSLSWANSIQSPQPPPTSWRSILILSSHLSLGLPSGLFPSGFLTKILYTTLLSPIGATCPAHLILLDFITRRILGEEYRKLSASPCCIYSLIIAIIIIIIIIINEIRKFGIFCVTSFYNKAGLS